MGLLGSNHSKEQMIVTFDRAYDTLISVVAQSELTDVVMIATTITHTDGTDGPSILFTGESIDEDAADADCGFSFITIWETDT